MTATSSYQHLNSILHQEATSQIPSIKKLKSMIKIIVNIFQVCTRGDIEYYPSLYPSE